MNAHPISFFGISILWLILSSIILFIAFKINSFAFSKLTRIGKIYKAIGQSAVWDSEFAGWVGKIIVSDIMFLGLMMAIWKIYFLMFF